MGCGCGGRAVRVISWLDVRMKEEYIREHHFKATMEALWIVSIKRPFKRTLTKWRRYRRNRKEK